MQGDWIVIIADDIFIGANIIQELIYRWELVLQRFKVNNLTLSARKAIICLKNTYSWLELEFRSN